MKRTGDELLQRETKRSALTDDEIRNMFSYLNETTLPSNPQPSVFDTTSTTEPIFVSESDSCSGVSDKDAVISSDKDSSSSNTCDDNDDDDEKESSSDDVSTEDVECDQCEDPATTSDLTKCFHCNRRVCLGCLQECPTCRNDMCGVCLSTCCTMCHYCHSTRKQTELCKICTRSTCRWCTVGGVVCGVMCAQCKHLVPCETVKRNEKLYICISHDE